jgi:hypothetical protein
MKQSFLSFKNLFLFDRSDNHSSQQIVEGVCKANVPHNTLFKEGPWSDLDYAQHD